jgi:hypothetical protein
MIVCRLDAAGRSDDLGFDVSRFEAVLLLPAITERLVA